MTVTGRHRWHVEANVGMVTINSIPIEATSRTTNCERVVITHADDVIRNVIVTHTEQ